MVFEQTNQATGATNKKCIMCGNVLDEYRPVYYVYEFYQHIMFRQYEGLKTINLKPNYFISPLLTKVGWNCKRITVQTKPKFRAFMNKLHMKKPSTYYFCHQCGQIYAGVPSYNFRVLPLRKRIGNSFR